MTAVNVLLWYEHNPTGNTMVTACYLIVTFCIFTIVWNLKTRGAI